MWYNFYVFCPVSAIFREGTEERKMQDKDVITEICRNAIKIRNIKMVKKLFDQT
jgi:hypothetical protein